MNLQKDLREFIELLSALDVRFVVVGAFAVAFHGYPRYTSDIDLFVDNSADNATLLVRAIERFGFEIGLTVDDFTKPDQVVQLGVAPNRIDLLPFISGVSFADVWDSREQGDIGGVRVPFISKEMLKRNKLASGRLQDLADVEHLG